MSLTKIAASGIRWTTLSMVGVTGLQTTKLIVLGRILSPEAFGLMAIMMVIIELGIVISQMGLSQAVIHRPEPKENELVSLYWLNIGMSAFVCGAFAAVAPLVAKMYNSPDIKRMFPVLALTFLINPLGDLYRAMLEKKMQFNILAGIEIFVAIVNALATVILAIFEFGVWALIWGQIVGSAIKSLGLFFWGKIYFKPRFYFKASDLDGYIKFGMHRVGGMILNFFNSRTDQLIIGGFLGAQALGYYNMAFSLIIRPIQRINPILTRVAFPIFSKVQNDTSRIRRGYLKMMNAVSSVNSPILIGIAAVAGIFIPTFIGKQWEPIVPIVQVLAIFSLIRSFGNASSSMVLAKGRADTEFYWNVFVFCIKPIAILCAVYFGGLIVVAWTLLILQICLFVLSYIFVVRRLVGATFKMYIQSIIVPLVLAIAMGLTVIVQADVLKMSENLPSLIVHSLSGAFVYILLYYIVCPEKIRLVKTMFQKT